MRISTKTISLMAGSLFVVGLAAGTNVGCGSSSDNVSLCNQTCEKEISCLGDAAATFGLTKASCMSECMKANNSSTCTNASTIASDFQACLKMSDCTDFDNCIQAVPECTGAANGGSSGTHTGGSSGTGSGAAGGHATGGTTGAAGNGGTADCSVCSKASACCAAEAALSGQSAASCSALSVAKCNAGDTTSTAANCQTIVQAGAALSLPACQ